MVVARKTKKPIPTAVRLESGAHGPGTGYCVMELIAYLQDQPWSDAPPCVAPTLRRYAIVLNDRAPDDVRQRLLPYVDRLVGTAPESQELAQRRAYLAADRAVRVIAPLALVAQGFYEHATVLRELPPITDRETALNGQHTTAYAAYVADAADVAAAADAADAAYAAYVAADATATACAAAAAAGAEVWDEAYRLLDDLIVLT